MFHKVVSDVECVNIDPFFLDENETSAKKLISDYSKNADIAVIEGVMGLYDGKNENVDYSTYSVAKMTESPTIAIINAKGMSLTALALAEGIVNYEKNGNVVCEILFNNMGSAVYNQVLAEYEKRRQTNPLYKKFEIIGHINSMPDELRLESRHLGLITPDNVQGVREKIAATYEYMKETVEWDRILELAGLKKSEIEISNEENKNLNFSNDISMTASSNRPIIAVAHDDAFNFYYEENLRALKSAGAELVYFSPLADEPVPENASGIYIGGGYPESHLKELSENENTKNSIRHRMKLHTPIIAECGGFMYLTKSIDDSPMCGIIKANCTYTGHLVRFGYVTLTASCDNVIMRKGDTVRGHEFHYYESFFKDGEIPKSGCTSQNLKGETYNCIIANDWMFAGFPHIYFPSCDGLAQRFVDKLKAGEK
jgi:cobyrinic acid a,c-diamide synthase